MCDYCICAEGHAHAQTWCVHSHLRTSRKASESHLWVRGSSGFHGNKDFHGPAPDHPGVGSEEQCVVLVHFFPLLSSSVLIGSERSGPCPLLCGVSMEHHPYRDRIALHVDALSQGAENMILLIGLGILE